MKFTPNEMANGELAVRRMSNKAIKVYDETDPVSVVEYDYGDEKRYFVDIAGTSVPDLLLRKLKNSSKIMTGKKRKNEMTFKELREASGMTRPEFAEYFEIPYRTIQSWELGERSCPNYVLKLIEFRLKNEEEKKKQFVY